MITTLSTKPGANSFTVRDEFHNLSDLPQDFQILYHWNFGPPFLNEGARFVAPARTIAPRNARAVEGLASFDVYGPPVPGFAEQVYFFEMETDDRSETCVLLRDRAGTNGVALRFSPVQLPAFTLWKNTGGEKSGYVTGLEPGTNYPNPKPFEKARGRVVTLPPGGSHVAVTTVEVLLGGDEVARVEDEIQALQSRTQVTIHPASVEPFSAA